METTSLSTVLTDLGSIFTTLIGQVGKVLK